MLAHVSARKVAVNNDPRKPNISVLVIRKYNPNNYMFLVLQRPHDEIQRFQLLFISSSNLYELIYS